MGKKIESLKKDGLSQHKIAKKLKIAQSTVSDYLKSIGYESDQSKTKKAVDTKKTFDRERRLALNDAFFDKICDMMKAVDKPSGLRDLAVTYGIIEDKRSNLDPVQTENEEALLTKIVGSLESHAISTQTGRCLPGLPENPSNSAVRLGEERKD